MNGKKVFGLVMIGYMVVSMIILFPLSNPVASTDIQEIDIVTTPEKVSFDVTNMKPGDWATRTLTITNSGKQDFNYLSSSHKKSGSDKLYNNLLLTISDKNGEVYKGILANFSQLEPRSLAGQEKEELTLTVELPYQLGNEYQGLKSVVEFKFYVEGTMGGFLPVKGANLPDTATGTFNLIAAGILLIVSGSTLYLFLNQKNRDSKFIQ